MRPALFVAASIAIAAVVPGEVLRSVLATAASALLEATPFLLAGRLLASAAGARPALAAYLGCGCGTGPAARSLPAAAATWLLFGPALACARLAAAIGIAQILRDRAVDRPGCEHRGGFLDDLAAMFAPSLFAGITMQALPLLDLARTTSAEAAIAGAALGFASAPCALGSVAIAGALHARAPLAAVTFLCVAGLIDARTLLPRRSRSRNEDALGYLLAALALGIVALRGGAALVHPHAAWFLGASAIVAALLFARHRRERNAAGRLAPAFMLAGALVTAPPPLYRATETTLAGAFAGERVTFLGVLVRDRSHDALVRYAIVCCRADAAPVVLRLASRAPFPPGAWLRAEGTMTASGSQLLFAPARLERTAPPPDPFVYR